MVCLFILCVFIGHYSVSSSNEPCLVYVTFSGRIYIYHNVMLAHVHTVSLIQEIDDSEKVKEFLRERNRTGRKGKFQLFTNNLNWSLRVYV